MMSRRTYGGCADHAAVFGTLARAAGIPTVWVKTMDVDWIEDFRAGRPEAENYRGHVFLEVFLGGRWWLLDAEAMRLYGPGTCHRRRGSCPATVWRTTRGTTHSPSSSPAAGSSGRSRRTRTSRSSIPSLIPWGQSEDLLEPWRVWVTGNSPMYRYAAEACRRLGYHVMATFNTDWDHQLRQARGKTLIVTCQDRRPVLPEAAWDTLLPAGDPGDRERRRAARGGLPGPPPVGRHDRHPDPRTGHDVHPGGRGEGTLGSRSLTRAPSVHSPVGRAFGWPRQDERAGARACCCGSSRSC